MDGYAGREQADRLVEEDHETTVQTVRELFEHLDVDNDGALDRVEVRTLVQRLGMQTDIASVDGIMSAIDSNRDGTVTLVEFLAWWRLAGVDFKQRVAALAAEMAEQCAAEDAAALLTQRRYRGYRARHKLMISHLAVRPAYTPPNIRCIHVLQLARILRSPPDTRSPCALDLVERLIARIEVGQPTGKRFFEQLEPNTRKMLLSRCRIVTYKAAHYVFEQGERSNDTFYFVISGKVGVVIDSAKKFEMLGGATFGEKALSQESHAGVRTAGILAVTDCIMATLTRGDYYRTDGSLEKHVVNVLRMRADDRTGSQVALVKSLLSETEFFKKLHHDSICTQLSRSCQHVHVRKNELLFRQGDDADKFYIVVQGHVRVVINGTVVLNLGPGMTFGELGVTGEIPAERRRTATIIGGEVPGVSTKQEWERGTASTTRSKASMDGCDLAVISRDDYLFYTQGSEHSVRQALLLSPDLRTDEHLKLLMNLFAESRFFKRLSSVLMQRQVCRNLKMELRPPGHTLFREGDVGDNFYLIIRGSVTGIVPTKSAAGLKSRTFELQAGDMFGDLAVTGRTEEERKRSATMRCKEECFFATLSRASYLKATGALEEGAYAILRKPPTRRTDADLALLSSFFEELGFFKNLHFPMLQTACCSKMQLKALDAKDVLFEQKEWSDGVFYILLRGRLRVEIDGREVERYLPTQEFGTSEHALSVGPEVDGGDNFRLHCDRTVIAMAQRGDQRFKTRARIHGFPRSWTSNHVFEVFKGLGKIDTVKMFSKNGNNTESEKQIDVARWAVIQFAHESVAQRACREKMVVLLDEVTGLPIVRSMIDTAARKPLSEAFHLGVNMADAAHSEEKLTGQAEHIVESSRVEQPDADRDVVVATLARDDYIAQCHEVLQEIMAILGMKPRSRTIKQLHLLKDFMATTDVFADLSHSNMLQRNLARFLGVIHLEPKQQLYEEFSKADAVYIVIRGRIQLCSTDVPEPKPDDLSHVRTAGQTLGAEATQKKPSHYLYTAVADGPTIVAVVYRDDYRRICATDDMQRTIDTFWALGVQESAPLSPDEEPCMDFDGYKQLYLRIGKVIATKERFSMSELRSSMHEDWRNDLSAFGDPSSEILTHWQYTESLYQLIDEWCGGVESTKLYADLLRLMLDFSTDATDNGLVLKPLQNVPCQFQRLSDMRHIASQEVIKEQQCSKIGTTNQVGRSSGFGRAVLVQRLAHSGTANAPKLGDTQTAEHKQEQYFREMFNSIDVDGSGTLDRAEVAQLSVKLGRELRKLELDAAMAEMDPDGDGSVDFNEFKTWFKSMLDADSLVHELFAAADKDESGVIDREELRLIMKELGNPLSPSQLDEAMATMDSDGSGEIDFVEFSAWWSKLSSTQRLRAKGQDPQAQYYKEMFLKADTGGAGHLTREELRVLMTELGRPMADHELDTAMRYMDEDGGGTVDFGEFQKWFSWLLDGDMTVRKIFDSMDADGSGLLDHEEIKAALRRLCTERDGEEMSDEQIQEAIQLMDVDRSGAVDFDEFSIWWSVYEFQQRFKPDDPVVAHYRSAFDQIAKQRAVRHDDDMKTAAVAIMQGRGTIDAIGFLQLCSVLGRKLYNHEKLGAMKAVTGTFGSDAEIKFEAFMNFFHDLKHKDHVLLTIFESADRQHFGMLLRDGVKRALNAFKQHHARRSVGTVSPKAVNEQSALFTDRLQQLADNQSLLASILHAASDNALSYSEHMEATLHVTVTDEEVDLALLNMYEYQRERYKLQRSKVHGPESTLMEPPLQGQIDFDTFRYWATGQQSKDPALQEPTRISQAEVRKLDRRKQFFCAMVESDPQRKETPGLSVDAPAFGNDDTVCSPTIFTPMSQRQPSSTPATIHGIGQATTSRPQPATSTGVPGQRDRTSRRSGRRRTDRRPAIELLFAHRRPLTPSGSSAAWPPMLPARGSTLGVKATTARTSQEKRNDGRRPRTFDELLQLTASDDENATMTAEWPNVADGSIASPGQSLSARGKFQPVDLRPKSAGTLQRFYNSDAARLSRGSSAKGICGAGLAGASEKRTAAKRSASTKTPSLRQLATAMDSTPGKFELWHERLSSTVSHLEPVPSFLDSTRGGRQYPGLGTRLNALHATRKAEAMVHHSDRPWFGMGAGIDGEPLIARVSKQWPVA